MSFVTFARCPETKNTSQVSKTCEVFKYFTFVSLCEIYRDVEYRTVISSTSIGTG